MTDSPVRKLFLKTYGCQMNVYDSQRMAALLKPLNFQETDDMQQADLVLLNTCHIREKAAEKVYSELGRIKTIRNRRRKQGSDTLIAVAGCVAQAEGEEMARRAPFVDMIVGPQSYHHLPELITKVLRQKGTALLTDFPEITKFDAAMPDVAHGRASAFVTIQEGCDKFCSFCVVPYTRGAEYSRSVTEILEEVHKALDQGVVEITLLGQNVNAYHGQGPDGTSWGLGKLLFALAELPKLQRIRYTTSHPRDVDDDLMAAHRDLRVLMPFLHLPVQSGSDKMLRAMNRKHTQAEYLSIIERLRQARPDIAFSSDFIVGFPGETEADFEDTLCLVRAVGYAQAYSFAYSPRPGTPASLEPLQVPEDTKRERLHRLQALIAEGQHTFNQTSIGKTLPVLLESRGKKTGQLMGRSPQMQSVLVQGPETWLNTLQTVHITGGHANSLVGVVAGVGVWV
ncbi:MAG: tRNA (N6-isopentenyl adenosine(37)-C2)-methylthiotransferase MiaB [Alphaproteobacteria bacterium]